MNNTKSILIITSLSIIFLLATMLSIGNNNYDNFLKKKNMSLAVAKEANIMRLSSDAFEDNDEIPSKYTCDGKDISPPLKISDVPVDAKSLALICEDPDAPMGTFVHWVMYNIPVTTKELKENLPNAKVLPDGSMQGITNFGKVGYGGPCPPSGTHRYFFKIYALNNALEFESTPNKADLEKKLEGHIIDKAELMGIYKRKV